MRAALALLVCAACADRTVTIAPVIDSPTDPDAMAFPDLDTLIVSVAHDGSDEDLVSRTFANGEALALDGVPFADDLVIHLTGQVGGSDVAYGRTCAFAVTSADGTVAPHLFFSRSVKFGVLAAQPLARSGGVGVTYHDGSALVLGGTAGGAAVATVERFDPHTGVLSTVADLAPRAGAAVADLGVGDFRVAVLGGVDAAGVGVGAVELIDADNPPARRVDTFDDAQMQMARGGLTATTLTDGRVIAIGGTMPATGAPSGVTDELSQSGATVAVRELRAVLAHPRYAHTATRLGDDVGAPILIAGGRDAAGAVAVAELYKPLSEDLADPATFAPAMLTPRWGHRASLMPDGSVLIIGGVDAAGGVLDLERFTIDGGFVAANRLPDGAAATDFTVTTLGDGRILITGGRDASGNAVSTALIARLDALDGSVDVVATDHLSTPRAGHQAALLCDGSVLITGGTDAPVPAERYNPPATGRR